MLLLEGEEWAEKEKAIPGGKAAWKETKFGRTQQGRGEDFMRRVEVGRSSAGTTGVVAGGNSYKPSFFKVATSLSKVVNICQFWHQTGLVLPIACAASRSSQWG